MKFLKSYLTAGLLLTCLNSLFSQSSIDGELRKWHTVTLYFNGPNTSENNSANPFLNYRLNVTFTSPTGDTYVVPGFYAADGNAAETSSNSGNKWAVRFTPDETGEWSYNTSFRTGSNIAVNENVNAGSATSFNGTTGNLSIKGNNKSLPDNRAKGRLSYVGERYLKFEETNEYFLKAGTDSPENLLAYDDFDNTLAKKTWSPHAKDWNAGDPTWKNGKGKELIGAVNYLAEKGLNSFSFLTMNINGDGSDVWPYAATSHNSVDGTSSSEIQNRLRFDVSKLEQWEILFSHAGTKGMYLHIKTQEEENDQLLDGGKIGVQRKLYFRELIARFGHHLALNWNMGEENTQTIQQKKDAAKFIKNTDPYDHHIVMHTFPHHQNSIYSQLVGTSEYTGASLQTANIKNTHTEVKKWLLESERTGQQWVVACDEQGDHQTGVTVDAAYTGAKGILGDNRTDIRHKVLWSTLLAGGAGVEYYFGYQTGVTDLTAEDFRSRKTKWEDAKIALDFFNTYLPFWEMRTNDQLTSDSNDYCFSKNGEVYAIYLPNGGSTNINLSSVNGSFSIKWFNPSKGGTLLNGSVSVISGGKTRSIGNPPNNANSDWVALIQKTEEVQDIEVEESDEACATDFIEKDGLVIIEAENLEVSNGWSKKTTANGFTGEGYLEWTGNDSFNTPGNGTISTSINITKAGTYRFEWRNKIGKGTKTTDFNDSWLRFPDADDFYGERSNGNRVYPKGSGKSPAPEGASANGWMKVYSNGTTNWTFSSLTNDGIGYTIYVTFENPGDYTMEISGRSKHHLIDRITLNNGGTNSRNLSLQETVCEQTETTTIAVTGLELDSLNKNVDQNESFTLKAIVQPADASDKTVTWSSSDSEIAVVDANGNVTAKKAGVTTVTATTIDGGFSSTAVVTVSASVTSVSGITSSPETKSLNEGASFGINTTIAPINAANKKVLWTSSDPKVAKVNENGLVTALKAGNATITVTTEDGNFKSTTAVAVQAKTRIPVRIVRTNSNIRTVPFGSPFTIEAYIIPSNATNKAVTWTSSDPSIATVDANGVVTPLKPGKVSIIVRSVDGGKESDADITIKGNNPAGKQAKSLTISPNPARVGSRIHLEGMPRGIYQVEVIAFDGSVVATEPADVTNSHYLKYRQLRPGVYIIRVTGIQGVYTGKLVIQ